MKDMLKSNVYYIFLICMFAFSLIMLSRHSDELFWLFVSWISITDMRYLLRKGGK